MSDHGNINLGDPLTPVARPTPAPPEKAVEGYARPTTTKAEKKAKEREEAAAINWLTLSWVPYLPALMVWGVAHEYGGWLVSLPAFFVAVALNTVALWGVKAVWRRLWYR